MKNVKVGDFVIPVGKYDNGWVDAMDETKGKLGYVTKVLDEDYCDVQFLNPECAYLYHVKEIRKATNPEIKSLISEILKK